ARDGDERARARGAPSAFRRAQGCWRYASTGMASLISSPGLPMFTPVVMPHSDRLIVAVASAPHIGFLLNVLAPQWKPVTTSATGFAIPSIVSSPFAATIRSPSNRTSLDVNVIVG